MWLRFSIGAGLLACGRFKASIQEVAIRLKNRFFTNAHLSYLITAGLCLEGCVVNQFGLIVKPSLNYAYIHEVKRECGITLSPNQAPSYRTWILGFSAPDNIQQLEVGLKAQLSNTMEFHVNLVNERAAGTTSTLGALGMSCFF